MCFGEFQWICWFFYHTILAKLSYSIPYVIILLWNVVTCSELTCSSSVTYATSSACTCMLLELSHLDLCTEVRTFFCMGWTSLAIPLILLWFWNLKNYHLFLLNSGFFMLFLSMLGMLIESYEQNMCRFLQLSYSLLLSLSIILISCYRDWYAKLPSMQDQPCLILMSPRIAAFHYSIDHMLEGG